MKTANLTDLGNPFTVIAQWLEQGETVQLLRQGRPFARIEPEPFVETIKDEASLSVTDPVALLRQLHDSGNGLSQDSAETYMAKVREDRQQWRSHDLP